MALSVDASNACIPPSHPLITSVPPLPSTTRGEPCVLDGRAGRLNASSPILLYASGKLVVVRTLGGEQHSFCYRGHTAPVTAAAFSTSGAYVASADVRGKLRVWSYDNEEHLVKLELQAMSGPIRGIAWDVDSMRIAIVGDRGSDASSDCCRIIQWDTGVTCGELGQHARGRASSVAFKLDRPLRIVTGGTDDSKLLMNAGPPFKRLASSDAHVKGAVHAVAYGGTVVASVGTDKSVCIHDGKTLELIVRKEHVHEASIYACAWSSNNKYLLTCSADGTVKLLEVGDTSLDVVHTWNVLSRLGSSDKVPIGGMQLGCAFVKDDVPVTVGMNGEIVILPRPPVLGGTVAENEQVLTGHHAPISCLAVCDGFFYTADTDGVIVQWNSETGKAIKRLRPSDDEDGMYKIHGDAAISCITVTSDGTLLSAGWDDTIRISRNAVVTPNHIAMDAQPNAIACGTNLVVVMTVGGLVFVKGMLN
jgi:WD repeat-containing protein 1 (actin-interacting protein 1)